MSIPIHNSSDMRDRPVAVDHPLASDDLAARLLQRLRLTAEDLAVLRRQGAVQIEQRGRRFIGKLRFRRGSKQVVRYLGGAEAARRVQEELTKWQAQHRKSRELKRLAKVARAALRGAKKTLVLHLQQTDFRFHGLAIRRRSEPPASGSIRSAFSDE